MNSWTISRRIIFGFAAMLLISVALGAIRPLAAVGRQPVRHATGGQHPAQRAHPARVRRRRRGTTSSPSCGTPMPSRASNARHSRIASPPTGRALTNCSSMYEPLISDSEDRRLFEEAKRTRAAFVSIRTRYLELVRQGKAEEHKKLLVRSGHPRLRRVPSRRLMPASTTTRNWARTRARPAKADARIRRPARSASRSRWR